MYQRSLLASSAMVMVLSATSALAVTPEEVWANWQSLTAQGGASLTAASQSKNGATLELTDVSITQDAPEIFISGELDKVSLTDNGDGTVTITMPDSFPMHFSDNSEGEPVVTLRITQAGASLTAKGDANNIGYDFTYPEIGATLEELKGDEGQPVDVSANLVISALTGSYSTAPAEGGLLSYDYDTTAEGMELTVSGQDPNSAGTFSGVLTVKDLQAMATGVNLPQEEMIDLTAALAKGFAVDSHSSSGEIKGNFELTEEGQTSAFGLELASSHAKFAMDKTRFDYAMDTGSGKISVNAPAAGLPPVDASFAETAFSMLVPIAKSDVASDMTFVTKLVDLTISDAVWDLFDPSASLSRDPATFILDLAGKGAWTVDILDPKVFTGETPMPDMPIAVESLNITELLMRAIGTEITGTGALTFDNSDLATFGGIPAPEGTINLTFKGLNTTLDKLIALGLITEEDATPVRFGLMMIAKAGAGEDELVSEIEFKDKGLFVNGQQLQ